MLQRNNRNNDIILYMAGIQSRIIGGRRVEIGSKAEQRLLAQGLTPETTGASSSRANIASRGFDTTPSTTRTFAPAGLGTPSLPQSITAQNLNQGSNFELPPTPVSTAIPAAKGAMEAGAEQTTSDLKRYLIEQDKQAKLASDESNKEIRGTMKKILDLPQQQADLEEEANIAGKTKAKNEARKQVQNFNNQLIQEQRALLRQTEEIEKNKEGMLAGAMQSEINRVSRESLRKQADISLNKLVAQASFEDATFDLDTAQSLVDHKIALQLEPLEQKLKFDQFFAERNYNKLDTSEKRILDQLFAEDKRAKDQTETDLKTANDYLLKAGENGVPLSVFQSIQGAINSGDYDQARELSEPFLAKPENLLTGTSADLRTFATLRPDLEVGTPQFQQSFNQFVAQQAGLKRAPEKGVDFPLSDDKKRVLLGANLTLPEISSIESDIKQFGISKVLEGITEPAQKKAIQDVYGGKEGTRLNRQNVAQLFGMLDDEAKTGFLGFFGRGKTNKEKLDELMASIKKYQDVGYSDEDILKLMK